MIQQLADEVMEHLELGDHLYPDVRVVVEGKLQDRATKVLPYLQKKYGDKSGKDRMLNRIIHAMTGLLAPRRRFSNVPMGQGAAFALMKHTADYYREKYGGEDGEDEQSGD